MSKKTRKKSSKPSPKSRKTQARKSPAAKTPARTVAKASAKRAGKTASRGAAPSAKKPAAKGTKTAAKTAAKEAVRKPPEKPVESAKTASSKSSHKPTPKQLIKSNQSDAKPAGTGLAEGIMAPAFNLPRDGGGSVSLADYAGKKLVLFFYPRADTPGCTREAIDFTRLRGEFADAGAEVVGISADTVKAQDSFRDKHELSIPLISDERHEMLEAYGAWGEKSMYGRTFMGIIRTTVLIGADGRIARIWRNVRVDGHADEVLEAARAL